MYNSSQKPLGQPAVSVCKEGRKTITLLQRLIHVTPSLNMARIHEEMQKGV